MRLLFLYSLCIPLLVPACTPAPEQQSAVPTVEDSADTANANGDGDSGAPSDGDSAPGTGDGDGDGAPGDGDTSSADGDGASATDFTAPGVYTVAASTGAEDVTSCTLEYALYTPSTVKTQALVVLGHGFQRGRQNVAALATHLASYGVRVVAPDYCHSWLLDTDHAQNAVDAVELASALAPGQATLYAGHSAGGLSAVLAAAQDAGALALLGLDTTDAGGAALAAAPGVDVPALGLAGEPSSCNASGNGVTAFDAIDEAFLIRVKGANHCDFEAPTSAGCTALCGAGDASKRSLIAGLAAAFVAWQTGLDASGRAWIETSGSVYQELKGDGLIAAP